MTRAVSGLPFSSSKGSRDGDLCVSYSHLFAVAHFHLAGGAESIFTHRGAYFITNREEEEENQAAAALAK